MVQRTPQQSCRISSLFQERPLTILTLAGHGTDKKFLEKPVVCREETETGEPPLLSVIGCLQLESGAWKGLGQNAVWACQLCSWSSGEHVLHWEHCHCLRRFSMCCHCCLSWEGGGKGSVHIHGSLRTGSHSTAFYQDSPSGLFKYSSWGFVEKHWGSMWHSLHTAYMSLLLCADAHLVLTSSITRCSICHTCCRVRKPKTTPEVPAFGWSFAFQRAQPIGNSMPMGTADRQPNLDLTEWC